MSQENIRKEDNLALRAILTDFAIKCPKAHFIRISFDGSGDSFNSFSDWVALAEDETRITDGKTWRNLYQEELSTLHSSDHLEKLLWKIIADLDCNFNDEGASGEVKINLKTLEVVATSEYYERVAHSGESTEFYIGDSPEEEEEARKKELNELF